MPPLRLAHPRRDGQGPQARTTYWCPRCQRSTDDDRTQSVVGAGFGGLAATKRLAKAGVDVTLVDRHNYHTFQPLLYEVATAGLNAADVAYAVRGIFHASAT